VGSGIIGYDLSKTSDRLGQEPTIELQNMSITPSDLLSRGSGRAPDVEVFGIVEVSVARVWQLFRPFGKENLKWWPIYETMELLPPGIDEIGALRRFKLKSQPSTFVEKLVARDEEKFFERYDFVQVDPPIAGYSATATFVEFTPLIDPITPRRTPARSST
jgi:hypothetical protein